VTSDGSASFVRIAIRHEEGPVDRHLDDQIEEELEETFPASDPPGHTVETGIRTPVPIDREVDGPDDDEEQP
jgi:hypothetical protein